MAGVIDVLKEYPEKEEKRQREKHWKNKQSKISFPPLINTILLYSGRGTLLSLFKRNLETGVFYLWNGNQFGCFNRSTVRAVNKIQSFRQVLFREIDSTVQGVLVEQPLDWMVPFSFELTGFLQRTDIRKWKSKENRKKFEEGGEGIFPKFRSSWNIKESIKSRTLVLLSWAKKSAQSVKTQGPLQAQGVAQNESERSRRRGAKRRKSEDSPHLNLRSKVSFRLMMVCGSKGEHPWWMMLCRWTREEDER